MSQVVLEEVVKSFGGVKAADRVSLEIGEGEFFTLLGPSGCGKTTALRLIAGLEFPDRGRVFIAGREVTRIPPAQRRIAMVFQNYALYPHMTIAENIAYPLKIRKLPAARIADKVRETAQRLDIDRVLERKPAEVSGGQQQRAAVARAMVQDPLVYLFDEPLSNLDARLRLESRRFLKSILKENQGAAVYVTHDQTEAMALSDRVGLMKEGRLVQVGPPEELYLKPASTFVAGFVGQLPMNLIEGESAGQGGVGFVSGDFRLDLPGRPLPAGRITLGARPEDVIISEAGEFSAKVVDMEPLGSERILTVDICGVFLFVRVLEDQASGLGPEFRVSLPEDKLHFFDERGERIP